MSLTNRELVRIADAIRTQLCLLAATREKQIEQKLEKILGEMQRLQDIRKKLSVCGVRRWRAAAAKLRGGIEARLREISYCMPEIERVAQECDLKISSLREIYQELVQADEEFGNLRHEREGGYLSVTTDPIELEGIALGEFEIRLHIASLSEMRYNALYTIVALDPNPSASNEAVTHPHVSDERLCSGDAGAAIQTALSTGRICDFFLLVRSVLTHYNEDSPYVSLDNWNGVSCYECGFLMSGDESRGCHICEAEFCGECSSYCIRCDESTCLSCLRECSACQEQVCEACMTTCPDCDRPLCETCRDENECPCIEESEEDDEHDEHPTSESGEVHAVAAGAGTENAQGPVPATASPAIHTNSVGQAAVLP